MAAALRENGSRLFTSEFEVFKVARVWVHLAAAGLTAPRGFASKFVNLREFIELPEGGHCAAWEKPERYAGDLRRAAVLSVLQQV